MRWLVALALLVLALGAVCWPKNGEETAMDYRRDELIRAEAGKQYRLHIATQHESQAHAALEDRLRSLRVPTTRASRSAPRRRSAPKRCARQRGLEEIARDESGGNYTAQNPRSSASGKYQVLDGTWDGYGGYKRAKDAPPHVQEQWAREAYAKAGSRPWRASGC